MKRLDYGMLVLLIVWCIMGIPVGAEEQTTMELLSSPKRSLDAKSMESHNALGGELDPESRMDNAPHDVSGFSSHAVTSAVEKVLHDRPDLILAALEKTPVALADLVERAAQLRQARAEEAQWRSELKDPKVPEINEARPMRGSPQAPVTIVEYSDFECPYCQAVSPTVQAVSSQYEGVVRFVYKHNPLSFHPTAKPAARYFEAIALQDQEQAWRFHDQVFEQQQELVRGVEALEEIVGNLEIDHERLEQDLDSNTVEQRLASDRAEAERFGFDGTPAFVINGVSLIGNHPKEDFERIIGLVMSDKQESVR